MAIVTNDVRSEFRILIEEAYRASADLGEEVDRVLQLGEDDPLTRQEIERLLTRVITVLRRSAEHRGDSATASVLEGNIPQIIERVMRARERFGAGIEVDREDTNHKKVELVTKSGIQPYPVKPSPFFHGRQVPVIAGFVKTTDIQLWDENQRLDIHLGQFEKEMGRKPGSEDVLEIMLGKMTLPGVSQQDQFKITDLARSIAANGVRTPPIIDVDGTLLDGNRRMAACHYILHSDEFNLVEKGRAEYVLVWQLTEHATDDDRNAVVVSLNFEEDLKEPWPEYVKARNIWEEWQTMLALEPRHPSYQRQLQLRKELSKQFAMGPDPSRITRYIRMVDMSNEFVQHHVYGSKDEYAVKHRANEEFQYFDELTKGPNPGGVWHTLNQDEKLKGLVFDLLLQDKFKNWTLVRHLKHVNENVREQLARARDESDLDMAQDLVEDVLTEADRQHKERLHSPDVRIENFVRWLLGLPIKAFSEEISTANLLRLLEALKLVEQHVKACLDRRVIDETPRNQ